MPVRRGRARPAGLHHRSADAPATDLPHGGGEHAGFGSQRL